MTDERLAKVESLLSALTLGIKQLGGDLARLEVAVEEIARRQVALELSLTFSADRRNPN